MKKIILIVSVLAMFSCGKQERSFESRVIEEKRDSTSVFVSYLQTDENSEFAKNFNAEMKEKKREIVAAGLFDKQKEPESLEEAVNDFLHTKYSDSMEMGGFIEVTDVVMLQRENFISVKTVSSGYWGGAHGQTWLNYSNFDGQTGKEIPNDALFTNKKKIVSIAEKYFREQKQMTPTEDINKGGEFWFEDGFSLPENIGFDDAYMILHYNPYEIACYACGATELLIPIAEVKEYLSVKF